jgi:hypothetical protein
MTDRDNSEFEVMDIEAMIRDAGDYIDVSADLRPKTLETARANKQETSSRFRIEILAVCIILLSLSTRPFAERPTGGSLLHSDLTADNVELYATARLKSLETSDDVSWSLVEAFRELRQRQSSVINEIF